MTAETLCERYKDWKRLEDEAKACLPSILLYMGTMREARAAESKYQEALNEYCEEAKGTVWIMGETGHCVPATPPPFDGE